MYKDVVVGICFGGGVETNNVENKLSENSRLRCDKALQLYHHKKINKILCTGGIFLLGQTKSVSLFMKEYLVDQGIPEIDIYIEEYSVDTIENIQFSIKLLQQLNLPIKHFVLISEKHHLERIALSWTAYVRKYSYNPGTSFEAAGVQYELTKAEKQLENSTFALIKNDPFGLSEEFEKIRKERRKNAGLL